MELGGIEWNRMEFEGMGWNRMELNGIGKEISSLTTSNETKYRPKDTGKDITIDEEDHCRINDRDKESDGNHDTQYDPWHH